MPEKQLHRALKAPAAAESREGSACRSRTEGAGKAETQAGGELGAASRSTLAHCVVKKYGLNLCVPPALAEPEIGTSVCLSGFLQYLIDLCC